MRNMRDLSDLIEELEKEDNGYRYKKKFHNGLVVIMYPDLVDAIHYLKQYKYSIEGYEKELDDNPNWRAGHPEKYGVRRN